MTSYLFVCLFLCAAATAAPPAPPRLYTQAAPAQLQQINPYDYYLDNPEVAQYYNQAQQKQGSANNGPNGPPSRLESLEPDSEVELIPGAQQPQQPPQQTPVSPNLPGLVPGQRVFIVHMPVPGYRPGSIGGYQPVYIVAAGPQGNPGFPGNGYQNTLLLDPSGQTVISPLLGYPRVPQQPVGPSYLLAPQLQALKGPYELGYQDPAAAYQAQPAPQASAAPRPVHLSQLIALQTHAANVANGPRAASNDQSQNSEPKRLAQSRESTETKEVEEPRRSANARPLPAHAQNKP